MQRLQHQWTSRGVVWLTVISSAPGKQGYVTASEENTYLNQANAAPTAVLLDPTGALGHLYDAKTCPSPKLRSGRSRTELQMATMSVDRKSTRLNSSHLGI